HTGEVKTVHEATGFELRKKPRIKHLVQTGDILLPNHRDSLIAKATASGRSVVIIGPELDGVLTTDRFIVLRSRVHPLLTRLILNSAGVRRQIVAQCRGAASLDIRERTLSSVWIPRRLVEKPYADEIINKALEVNAMQAQ